MKRAVLEMASRPGSRERSADLNSWSSLCVAVPLSWQTVSYTTKEPADHYMTQNARFGL